jgi:uncharacterized membrane protein YccC
VILQAVNWLRRHDPMLSALRRAARTAIVMPAMFALGKQVIGNPTVATFAAFGSFAMLLLVDFAGPMRSRLQAQAALALTGAVFVCFGTLASQTTWLAALAMAVVAFGVLFAGVVSSVLAGATTSLLVAFTLPVTLPGPASSIPDRLAGWGLASGGALLAVALLWPAPARDPVRSAAIRACRALATRLRGAASEAGEAVKALHDVFFATPYRPTGLSTAARAVVRLVDELKWLDSIVPADVPAARGAGTVCGAAAAVLERGADLLDAPALPPDGLHRALQELRARLAELEREAMRMLPAPSSLDPTFRAHELSYVVSQIAGNIDLAAAAERRSWVEQLLGRRPSGLTSPLSAAHERAGAHVERSSLWLQNSVRGAVALGLAVLVADLSNVQHAFWVVLGTLSVLRSNALSTGQGVLQGVLGTLAGFVVGAVLVSLIGTNTALLWVLLPPAVLFAGLAPATISFAAGQAAFTLVLLILFNLLALQGWKVGLVRIEDVLLGCAVSLLVGLLFWPRGASTALGRALSAAYVDSAAYLAAAVRFGALRGAPPSAEAARAAAASRRLDDTFRSYLAERGAKPLPLADVTSLVTGVVGLRLAGDAVLDLWRDGGPDGADDPAGRELAASGERMAVWYDGFAASLDGDRPVPEPVTRDELAERRLVDALDGEAGDTAVRLIWTGDHLDAARRLQATLAGPARTLSGA